MEQENKVVREAAKKERNTVVRNLVAFVRKRDRRVAAYRKKLEERAEENKKKTQERQKKQRQERKKLLETGATDNGSFGMSGLEDQLRQLEGEYTDSEEELDDDEEDLDDEEPDLGGLEELYCVACEKMCKSIAAKENHETSRKHKENMEKLIEEMKIEEGEIQEGEEMEEEDDDSDKDIEDERESIVEIRCTVCDESFKTEDAKSQHESSKKHRKNLKLQDKKTSGKVEDEKVEKPDDCDKSNLVDDSKKKGKGKNRRRKDKDKDYLVVPEEEDVINSDTTENIEVEKENCENILEKENCKNSKESDSIEDIPEYEKSAKSKKGGKTKKNLPDTDDTLARGNLTCAQCKAEFPSKNKLYNHLKSTGHAVFLPKSGAPVLEEQKKKRGKK